MHKKVQKIKKLIKYIDKGEVGAYNELTKTFKRKEMVAVPGLSCKLFRKRVRISW